MDNVALKKLEHLNKIRLTEKQENAFLSFYYDRTEDFEHLNSVDTSQTERMVHSMPFDAILRKDVPNQSFSRDELLKGAPDSDNGYRLVPKVLD